MNNRKDNKGRQSDFDKSIFDNNGFENMDQYNNGWNTFGQNKVNLSNKKTLAEIIADLVPWLIILIVVGVLIFIIRSFYLFAVGSAETVTISDKIIGLVIIVVSIALFNKNNKK